MLVFQTNILQRSGEKAEAGFYVCERPIPQSENIQYVAGSKEYVFSKNPCGGKQLRLKPKTPITIIVPAIHIKPRQKTHRSEHFVIHFHFADSTLSTNAQKILLEIVKKAQIAKRIKIKGCTCWITKIKGGNERVARKRAQTVAKFLISHGVPREKLFVTWSAHCPYVDTKNPAPNRRVEVEIE